MLDIPRLKENVRTALRGSTRLHRAALAAIHARNWERAEELFEAAAERYRRELEVEALARLRVHQMMARVLAGCDPGSESQRCLEVERRLCRLDRIESLQPPFALIDARSVLASWIRPGLALHPRDERTLTSRKAA